MEGHATEYTVCTGHKAETPAFRSLWEGLGVSLFMLDGKEHELSLEVEK